MYQVQQITNDPLQKQTIILPSDGSSVGLTMYYVPQQYCWLIKDLTWNDFRIQNMRICVSPNILYQFKNQIPFGLACFSSASREPTQQQDFQSGAAKLYILTAEEVEAQLELLRG